MASRQLQIVGLNHTTAPVGVRERLALSNGDVQQAVTDLVSRDDVQEAVVVSTCNRVEVVACCHGEGQLAPLLAVPLFKGSGVEADEWEEFLYGYSGREAVRHLFRVASSLDSMVVGEPQILGQLKEHFELSVEAKATGPVLHRFFHKSFSVAKRVRSETGVASRTVSVASTAVDLAGSIFETLDDRAIMLIGVGEMGEAAARHLLGAGVKRVMVANRTFENAVALARTLDGTPIPLERMSTYLPLADLVIGSAGGGRLLEAADVRALMKERRNKPVFFIDLAVPRNFDPAINDVDNAYLYDIDDLGGVVEENLDARQREAIRGEAIVEGEVDTFWQWFEKLEVIPTIVDLREYAERIRNEEFERTLARTKDLEEADRERLDQMTRAIVNKLLHQPTMVLKDEGSGKEESELLTAVRKLFGLGVEP